MAAIGGTREAFRAGTIAEMIVTPVPTTSATITVCALMTVPPAGMSNPNASSTAFSPLDSAIPAPSPITDTNKPTSTASVSTDPMTWRPLAPRARSSAISRSRCATTIENVLKMMKVATNNATRAKTISATLKNWKAFLMSLWFSFVICAPVRTWYVLLSSVAAIRLLSVC